jgi:hypothetical protein
MLFRESERKWLVRTGHKKSEMQPGPGLPTLRPGMVRFSKYIFMKNQKLRSAFRC